jgi:hypothetical protein
VTIMAVTAISVTSTGEVIFFILYAPDKLTGGCQSAAFH